MGQRRVTIEMTEYQARTLRWALNRANMVGPRRYRENKVFWRKFTELKEMVEEATDFLNPVSPKVPGVPKEPSLPNRR